MKKLLVGVVAMLGLGLCVLAPVLYFQGQLNVDAMKRLLLWFAGSIGWSSLRRRA